MLTTGYQLKAARALIGMEQIELAKRCGVSVTTIRTMEAKGPEILTSGLDTIRKVQRALEEAGVEFIPENGGGAGIRLKKPVGAA